MDLMEIPPGPAVNRQSLWWLKIINGGSVLCIFTEDRHRCRCDRSHEFD